MHTTKRSVSRRHVVTRFLVTTALLGSTFVVGLATTASAAGPYQLAVHVGPSGTVASGAALSQQPVIWIDSTGNSPDPSATGSVTASITSGVGSLVGTTTVASSGGVATFTNLGLNELVGNYTLTFTDTTDSATPVVSSTIAVTVGAATKLAFSTAPAAGAVSGVALTPQPVVDVVDSGGNVVTTDTSTVTAAYTGAGSTLTNNTKAAVAGVAAFSGLTITAPIDTTTGTLNFTDGSLTPISSGSIPVTGPGTKLAIITAPSTSAVNGAALPIQPVIAVEDASGAILKGDTSTVTAALVSGNTGSSITNSTKVVVLGEASFIGLAINAAPGSYYITFTDGTLTPVTTTLQTTVAIGLPSKLVITTEPSTPPARASSSPNSPSSRLRTAAATSSPRSPPEP